MRQHSLALIQTGKSPKKPEHRIGFEKIAVAKRPQREIDRPPEGQFGRPSRQLAVARRILFWRHSTKISLGIGGLDLSADKELGFVLGSNDQASLACISPNFQRERFLWSDPTEQEFDPERIHGIVAW